MANCLRFGLTISIAILTLNINKVTSLRKIKTCDASGHIQLSKTTTEQFKNNSKICQPHKNYPKYHCSPLVKSNTHAIMTINTFEKHISKVKYNRLPITTNNDHGLDGDRFQNITTVRKNNSSRKGMSKCGKKYYNGKDLVVALSTGWYSGGSRCLKSTRIKGNKKLVVTKVVDECDSVNDCDLVNGFRVPCGNNIIDASPAVWKALGIWKSKMGTFKITWFDI